MSNMKLNAEEMIALYKKGWTSRHLGDRFGVHHTTILYQLEKSGVPRRPSRTWSRSRRKHPGSPSAVYQLIKTLVPTGPCEECGSIGCDVHHKDENIYNNNSGNLERLCRDCHRDRHGGSFKPRRS